mgnify:CR=1 FL=1
MENKNAVGWFEIYVDDMNRAKSFYETVFSRKLENLPNPEIDMWAFSGNMTTYGSPGALVKMQGMPAGKNSVLVYFSCDDCATEEKRVVPAGGKVFKTKFPIGPHGFIALAHDTEGNLFGLHSMK